ncbi:MAG: type II secretion system F family protein [Candidatus Omnitrophica bacterium]|nr:type II secretion system F family protein [Candidatus Omnitrophota bacterium]
MTRMDEMDLMFDRLQEDLDLGKEKKIDQKVKIHLRIFAANLARLLKAGIPILRSLEIMRQQHSQAIPDTILAEIQDQIRQGKSLSEALQIRSGIFPFYYTQMIRAGECSGNLESVLGEVSRYLEREEERRRRVREALAYPGFVLSFGGITMVVLLKFVLPKLAAFYEEFGETLPGMTRVILSFGQPAVQLSMALCLLLIIGFLIFLNRRGRVWRIAIRWPVVGGLFKKCIVYRFASLLSLLLKSGIPILDAMDMVRDTFNKEFVRKDLVRSRKLLAEGRGLACSLQGAFWLSETHHALLQAGEESGQVPETLGQIAHETEREIESLTHFILKILEPAMIVGVGMTVAFLVISSILPIFEINEFVR